MASHQSRSLLEQTNVIKTLKANLTPSL